MKRALLEQLRCPIDLGPLALRTFESRRRPASERAAVEAVGMDWAQNEEEIVAGLLLNERLGVVYPVHEAVPRMLVFRSGVHLEFESCFGSRMRGEAPEFSWPDRPAEPGETEVLRTFSSEWTNYEWDDRAYWNQSADDWFRSMDFVLGLEPGRLAGRRVAEIGVGVGGVADHVSRTQETEVVGVDLGYAVDIAQRRFASANPRLHVVQASAFHLPFPDGTFDFVYSFGVLHHTHDTRRAVERVSRLCAPGGEYSVWVYSPEAERRTIMRRGLMALENVVRPVVSRLPERAQSAALMPTIPVYMLHQWVRSRTRAGQTTYGVREAMHAARDRLTPRYAHRHSEAELESWIRAMGFEIRARGSELERPEHVPDGFTANAIVRGERTEHAG